MPLFLGLRGSWEVDLGYDWGVGLEVGMVDERGGEAARRWRREFGFPVGVGVVRLG